MSFFRNHMKYIEWFHYHIYVSFFRSYMKQNGFTTYVSPFFRSNLVISMCPLSVATWRYWNCNLLWCSMQALKSLAKYAFFRHYMNCNYCIWRKIGTYVLFFCMPLFYVTIEVTQRHDLEICVELFLIHLEHEMVSCCCLLYLLMHFSPMTV